MGVIGIVSEAFKDGPWPYIPYLLKAYWILATSAVVFTLLPVPMFKGFKAAVRLASARGKLWHDKYDSEALGWLSDYCVSQSWFEHFYIVGALVNTLTLQLFIFLGDDAPGSTVQRDALIALMMFEFHLIRRYAESNWVLHYPDGAQMHLVAYLFGLTYYVVAPLTLLPEGLLSNKGAMMSAYDSAVGAGTDHWQGVDARVANTITAPHSDANRIYLVSSRATALARPQGAFVVWDTDQRQLQARHTGLGIFAFANVMQFTSHWSLGRLAKRNSLKHIKDGGADAPQLFGVGKGTTVASGAKPGAAAALPPPQPASSGDRVHGTYSTPTGGFFELVSCPHYLAEIFIYVGLAVVTRGTGAQLILAWVVVNLLMAAAATKQWYKTHFPAYKRKALIPFIF